MVIETLRVRFPLRSMINLSTNSTTDTTSPTSESNGLDGKNLIVYDRSKLPIVSESIFYNVIISTFDIYLFLYFGRLIKYY